MLSVEPNCLDLSGRVQKIEAARLLATQNRATIYNPNGISIRYICWRNRPLAPAGDLEHVDVEFATPFLANQAITHGLSWNGKRHTCQKSRRYFKLRQCYRCQSYSHAQGQCSATVQCGKCAGDHSTRDCKSDFYKCAICLGPHASNQSACKIRQAKRNSLLNNPQLRVPYYQVPPISKQAAEPETAPNNPSTLGPSSLTPPADRRQMREDQAQDLVSSSLSSLHAEHNKSPHLLSSTGIDIHESSVPYLDPEAILQELEHLKTIVAGLLPTAGDSSVTASTRKRRALDSRSVNPQFSRAPAKRIKKEDPYIPELGYI